MAKYIGTYATSGDVQTALDNQELSRPFIAYTTDNEKVIYGPNADRAEVGDIVVYSVADDLLHYIKQADYNTTNYPAASYVPVGVVAYPQNDDAILGPSGEITFIGLNWLDRNTPDTGKQDKAANPSTGRMPWGDDTFDIPELTNFTQEASARQDMDGKSNTQKVLQYATGQSDWRTASVINFVNGQRMYPLFECSWRYHTSGTSQGDWFVPALGQLCYLVDNPEKHTALTAGLQLLDAGYFSLYPQGERGSSTEVGIGNCWRWSNSGPNSIGKSNSYYNDRPFCSKLMTRI